MKHIIIGTAGHIDHGKTCLTQALTGTNTDRLKEEKARGITIENGFAQMILPDGQTASIIDVPGHEKFVRNMIVGATGIDLALMVIAADDGFMPQTREHLDILSLLEVQKGIIALTKIDTVDDEWADAIIDEIKENAKDSFLENAPIIKVSSFTGQGIEELKEKICESVSETRPKKLELPFRLPVDRVFSIQGFGTVATGTLTEGIIKIGDNVSVYPDDEVARVRELQNHDEHVTEASAGMRVAINLSGFDKEKLKRGDTIAFPGSLHITKRIDVKLKITDNSQFFIKNASRLHLFHGTSEMICKIRLLNDDEMAPGDLGYAQLILDEPIAARNGDKFILRFFSPVTTVGGGTMIDIRAGHRKRFNKEVLDRLDRLSSEDLNTRIDQYVADCGMNPTDVSYVAEYANVSEKEASQSVSELISKGSILSLGEKMISREKMNDIIMKATDLLKEYHLHYPLRTGMSNASFKKEVFGRQDESYAPVLKYMVMNESIDIKADKVCLKGYEPELSDRQKQICESFKDYFTEAGFEAPTLASAIEKCGISNEEGSPVLEYMCSEGILVLLSDSEAVTSENYEKALEKLKIMSSSGMEITLADFRTEMGFSRRYAQMFLEYWDKAGITSREGDIHKLNI